MGEANASLTRSFRDADGREHLVEPVQLHGPTSQPQGVTFGWRFCVKPPSGDEWWYELSIPYPAHLEASSRLGLSLVDSGSYSTVLVGVLKTGFGHIGQAIKAGRRLEAEHSIEIGSPEFSDLLETIRAMLDT